MSMTMPSAIARPPPKPPAPLGAATGIASKARCSNLTFFSNGLRVGETDVATEVPVVRAGAARRIERGDGVAEAPAGEREHGLVDDGHRHLTARRRVSPDPVLHRHRDLRRAARLQLGLGRRRGDGQPTRRGRDAQTQAPRGERGTLGRALDGRAVGEGALRRPDQVELDVDVRSLRVGNRQFQRRRGRVEGHALGLDDALAAHREQGPRRGRTGAGPEPRRSRPARTLSCSGSASRPADSDSGSARACRP